MKQVELRLTMTSRSKKAISKPGIELVFNRYWTDAELEGGPMG